MLRNTSPYGFDNASYAGSIQSIGYSTMDEVSSQASGLSRPSAKSIYLQRKEYAVSINKMMDKFQYRVEHLFTCDVDGKDVRNLSDCLERLKLLDGMGRVWGQDMLLEVRAGSLLLTDIETKEELESLSLSSVVELKAVMDSGVYSSLLIVAVQDTRKKTSVFMFQCDDVRADIIKNDLTRALSRKTGDSSSSNNLKPVTKPEHVKNIRNTEPPPEPKAWSPAEDPVSQWDGADYEDDEPPAPVLVIPRDPLPLKEDSPPPSIIEPVAPQGPYTETQRNVDILNHIFNDLEIFMGQVAAAAAKSGKKKKKKKKKDKAVDEMPSDEDFADCFQKIKFGLNLLGVLNGQINNPSAADFVHCIFSTLTFLVSHCHEDLPPTIVAPLLTPDCILLLSEEATPEEDQLWQSLGDPWNIPSTKWPEDDEDIPTYDLKFYDGWQPPEVTKAPLSRQPSQNSAISQRSAPWTSPAPLPTPRPDETNPSFMRVLYDFNARNQRELTIIKGEIVQLLDMSRQWWKVRNTGGEEGYVPHNVLEPLEKESTKQQNTGPPVLTKRSKSAEVTAWLEYKGFSPITVRCLGTLSGSMLLGMSRDELKIVCPEEGGRVFFQLQNVKTAMALANEVRPTEP